MYLNLRHSFFESSHLCGERRELLFLLFIERYELIQFRKQLTEIFFHFPHLRFNPAEPLLYAIKALLYAAETLLNAIKALIYSLKILLHRLCKRRERFSEHFLEIVPSQVCHTILV